MNRNNTVNDTFISKSRNDFLQKKIDSSISSEDHSYHRLEKQSGNKSSLSSTSQHKQSSLAAPHIINRVQLLKTPKIAEKTSCKSVEHTENVYSWLFYPKVSNSQGIVISKTASGSQKKEIIPIKTPALLLVEKPGKVMKLPGSAPHHELQQNKQCDSVKQFQANKKVSINHVSQNKQSSQSATDKCEEKPKRKRKRNLNKKSLKTFEKPHHEKKKRNLKRRKIFPEKSKHDTDHQTITVNGGKLTEYTCQAIEKKGNCSLHSPPMLKTCKIFSNNLVKCPRQSDDVHHKGILPSPQMLKAYAIPYNNANDPLRLSGDAKLNLINTLSKNEDQSNNSAEAAKFSLLNLDHDIESLYRSFKKEPDCKTTITVSDPSLRNVERLQKLSELDQLRNETLKELLIYLYEKGNLDQKNDDVLFFSNLSKFIKPLNSIRKLKCLSEIQSVVLKYASM